MGNQTPEKIEAAKAAAEAAAAEAAKNASQSEPPAKVLTVEQAKLKALKEWERKRGKTAADQTHVTSRLHPELGAKPDGYTYLAVPVYKDEAGKRYKTNEFLAERELNGWERVEPPHPAAGAAIEDMTVVMRIPTLVLDGNIDRAVEMMNDQLGAAIASEAGHTGDGDIVGDSTGVTMGESKTISELASKMPEVAPELEKPLTDEEVALLEQ